MNSISDTELLQKIKELKESVDNLTNLTITLTKLVQKVGKLSNATAKSLHLIPVSEEEEKILQITQRKNIQIAAKVNDDLNKIEKKPDADEEYVPFSTTEELFGDVLGDDLLSTPKKGE